MSRTGKLVYDDSERNADLFYLTGFLAGDPFLFLEDDGRRVLYLSDLEVDRGRTQSHVDEVSRLEEVVEQFKADEVEMPAAPVARLALLISRIARDRGLDGFEVPASFPVAMADALRGHGFGVRWLPAPFVPDRSRKTPEEVEKIRKAVEHTEAAMTAAIEQIRDSEERDGSLWAGGEPLTSEDVRLTIDRLLLERNCRNHDSIVAGGEHGVDPHDRGSGHLPADSPILLDIFPRDLASRYHGDMTRTVVKGKASPEVRKMFDAVGAAKAAAESLLRDGVDGCDVHGAVVKTFEDAGFETGQRDGRMVGFFHGTGHGLGLDVHEHPRLSKVNETMREGYVVTVEPGLYYPGVGGMRLEDDILVTKNGCENLCTLPNELEV